MRRISFVLGLAFAASFAAAVAEPVHYSLALHRGYMDVTAVYPGGGLEAANFKIASDNRPGRDFSDDIEKARAESLAGKTLKVERPSPRQWRVLHHGEPFKLMYRVVCAKPSFEYENSVFHPTLLRDWALLIGSTWHLQPQDPALADLPILARVSGSDYPNVTTSWRQDEPLPSQHRFMKSLIIAGDFSFHRIEVAGKPVTIAYQGSRWRFSREAMTAAIQKILSGEARAMGFYPVSSLLIAYVEGSRLRSSGGTALHEAFFLYHDPDRDPLKQDDADFLKTIAHENFHLWNGVYSVNTDLPEGHTKWFTEGFTVYYASLMLLRQGILSPEGFRRDVNGWLRDYLSNPAALTATIPIMERDLYSGDRRYKRLNSSKGPLLALIFDLEMRRLTRGKRCLDDLMAAVMRRYPPGQPGYDNQKLRALFDEMTSSSWKDFFRRYVEGAEQLPFEEVARRSGMNVELAPQRIFELGFEIDGPEMRGGSRVTKVVPGSNAEKAGLRLGDVLGGFDLVWNTPDRRARFWVQKNGAQQELDFYPAKSTGRSLPFLSQDASTLAALKNLGILPRP